jgi:hypothetical protein
MNKPELNRDRPELVISPEVQEAWERVLWSWDQEHEGARELLVRLLQEPAFAHFRTLGR